MTPPTKHLEIFDEFSHCLHWELDKYKMVIDATPTEIKQHLIQTVISVLEEQSNETENKFYGANDVKVSDIINSLATTLSAWKALL